MSNMELLFQINYKNNTLKVIKKKLKLRKNHYYYTFSTKYFTMSHVLELILLIEYVKEKNPYNFPLNIDFGKTMFKDKLVLILLECIIRYVNLYNMKVKYNIKVKNTIFSKPSDSPLTATTPAEFNRRFTFDIRNKHFRRIIKKPIKSSDYSLSILMNDLNCFFSNLGVDEETSCRLSEVFAELVGNASEHAHSDCLIDIDLSDNLYHKVGDDSLYLGLNVAIINYSSLLFYEPLKAKMESGEVLLGRYEKVALAHKYHVDYFGDMYSENDFYTISSFQHKISGANKSGVGGTGLTSLIYSLKDIVEDQVCYMWSANRVLIFHEDYVRFDDDKFIGFNKSNNYFLDIPDSNVFINSPLYLPGTAYNLCFAIKKGWIE